MDAEIGICIILILVWIGICMSDSLLIKLLRWIFMLGLFFGTKGDPMEYRIMYFVVLFFPLIFKHILKVILGLLRRE